MAVRRPLATVSGQKSEIPDTDTLPVALITIGAPYVFGAFFSGTYSNNEVLTRYRVSIPHTFPSGLGGSMADALTAPTANATILVKKAGANVATVSFAAGNVTGTFTMGSNTSFANGDLLEIINQATADSTLAGVSITLKGTRT